jgi:Family of unknown function (DUF6166)
MPEPGQKTYHGYRRLNAEGHTVEVAVNVHEPGRDPEPLEMRQDLRLHSASFEWGYGGSGPAQLALALAADVLGDDERAQDVYQEVKRKLVGRLPQDGWSLTEEQLRGIIARIEHGREKGRGAH